MVGRVVSTKMEKTAVVLIERKKTHPLYGKTYSQSKKYLADDPFGVKDGDIVILHKIAPLSKRKHWAITKVLGQDYVSLQQAQLQESAIEAIEQVMPEERKEEVVEVIEETEQKKEKPKTLASQGLGDSQVLKRARKKVEDKK